MRRRPPRSTRTDTLLSLPDALPIWAVTRSRGYFPSRYFRHFPLPRRVESRVRAMVGLERHTSMEREGIRYGRSDSAEMFYVTAFLRDLGCRSDLPLRFCNHHTAQALAALFHTGWDEALVYTAGEGGAKASYGQRLLKYGRAEEHTSELQSLMRSPYDVICWKNKTT